MPRTIKLLVIIGLFFMLALAVQQGWLDVISKSESARAFIQQRGVQGYLMLTAAAILFMAVGGPRQIIAMVFGFIFGTLFGFVVALVVSGISLALTYFTAHTFLKPFIEKKYHKQSLRLLQWLRVATTRKTIMIRLMPVGSNVLTNLFAGAAAVDFKRFLIGSVIGYSPQTFIFVLVGSGIGLAQSDKLLISGLLFVTSSILGIHLFKKHRYLSEQQSQ
jgi:Uncharacterized conserved protein